MCKRISFLQVFSLFFCWYHCKHIFDKKNWALLADLMKVKNNMFLSDNGHTQKRRYSVIPTHEHPLGISHGNLNMAIVPYRDTLKRTAKLWGTRVLFSFFR